MTQNAPLSSHPIRLPAHVEQRVLSIEELKAHGVSPARAAAQCRDGGPWQQPLPGVYVLHPGPPNGEERLRSALLYAGRRRGATETGHDEGMVTGLAALTLHGFSAAPPLGSLDRIDVLVPRTRRLRSARYAHVVRTAEPPSPVRLAGLPVAPVARALADAVAGIGDTSTARSLLTEAVRAGHCEPAAVVRELSRAKLLGRAYVLHAVDSLLAEGRTPAECRLYEMVRTYDLPEPLWNVDLRLPGGPHLGAVDAYWPNEAVAVELDTGAPRHSALDDDRRQAEHDAEWSAYTAKREQLERLGVTVVHLTPKRLHEAPEQLAIVVRTALMAAVGRDHAAHVVILPR
ncbi:hypothetical protein ACFU6I_28760 [Streptomyces sp. NPDC057486]|uniref:hypothetical protein n=1 Tax=Streptomyces sp. NPDC057486 TaxID=3346145 RepID=UPI003677C234